MWRRRAHGGQPSFGASMPRCGARPRPTELVLHPPTHAHGGRRTCAAGAGAIEPRGETFRTPPVDVTLSTRASVMAPFRKPRAQSSAVCLLLGAVAAVLGIIGLAAHHTHLQAASHHDVIHHFHASSSRLNVGSDTTVKLGGSNRAGHVSQHPKVDRFRSHARARVYAHKNADGDHLDDLLAVDDETSIIPVKTIRNGSSCR